ncbi:ATPase [Solibacillus silvestris StLB046]|uniref:ATPase n=1 Tax=Solibacillus silvestris (strain StLB046) TaxID=1002809 RepID=F2F3X0_SOLSS|nr:hypothetical protein [Solibacillus silvestris]BAK17768.1 ATPase [Solibacillus silvestris StLB046]
MIYIRKYVKVLINGDTYYSEKNIIGYYGEFLAELVAPFEIIEEVVIDVEEIIYLVNRIQDVKIRNIVRHYIAHLEKRVVIKEAT